MTLTRIEFQLLLALSEGPRHGYGIMQDVHAMTGGALKIGPGTLYTGIKRLLHAGLIEECVADADRRRCYRLTRRGRSQATEEAQRLAALVRVARRRGLATS
jgi:DNA-binding PadR family transcriptional regulator